MPSSSITNGAAVPVVQPAIESQQLPSSGAPELVLVPATTQEHEQCTIINSVEWKGPLDLAQYLERERVLLQQDLTNNSQLTPWILTSKALPPAYDGTRSILASCETILKTAYIARNGQIETIQAHGIGSVFTRNEHRGKGYAGRMMVELGKKLETWQQANGIKGSFSILFSDIGQKFYSRFGWKVHPSTHIQLEPLGQQQYDQTRANLRQLLKKGLPDVEDLETDDIKSIPCMQWLEDDLKVASEAQSTVPHVAIRPDMQHFLWHFSREEIQAAALGKPKPTVKGAIHKASGMAVIWCRVYAAAQKDYSLHILFCAVPPHLKAAPSPDTRIAFAALLLRAQREADAWGMLDGVEIWDPSGFVITAAQQLRAKEQGNVKVVRRDKNHICSLKWIGARPTDDPSGKLVWMNIEKYSWC